jgi:hypothetical protein
MTFSSLHAQMMSLGILGFALAACDLPDDTANAGTEERNYAFSNGTECPPWECGFNSAEVNGRPIRELNLDGEENSGGVKIVGFLAPAGLLGNYELAVENDELVAVGLGKTLRGPALIGATILVTAPGLLDLPLPITIAGYDELHPWAAGADPVPSYALVYPDVDAVTGIRNVCNAGILGALATSAVILGGETYDLESKTVVPDQDRWLTIACAGSAAAKLRLMNYGPQSDFDGKGNPASVEQRQATLKMLTADYCGDGTSYTANRTPLAWENADGTVATKSQTGDLEAVWSADGALCLETTRLADADVGCALPTCKSLGLDDGEWLTRVPSASHHSPASADSMLRANARP